MRDIEKEVYDTLETIYPTYEHGSVSEKDTSDDNYFSIEVIDSDYPNSYDDEYVTEEFDFIIAFYTTDPEHIKETARRAESALSEIGLISQGPPIPTKSDINARYGRIAEYKFIQERK